MSEHGVDPTEARQARARLARAEGDRRRAALARFVDQLDAEHRHQAFPDPGAATEMADPIGRLTHRDPAGGTQAVQALLPYGRIRLAPPAKPAELARIVGLAVASGNALLLAEPPPSELEPVIDAARRALDDAGLGSAGLLHGSPPEDVPIDAHIGDLAPTDRRPGAVQLIVDGTAETDRVLGLVREALAAKPRLDTVLVHEALASALTEDLVRMLQDEGVSVQAGEAARRRAPSTDPASAETWQGQPGRVGVRVVGSLDEALDHAIVHAGPAAAIATREARAAERFARTVPSPVLAVDAPPGPQDEALKRSARPVRLDRPAYPEDLTARRRIVLGDRTGSGGQVDELSAWLARHWAEA